MGTVEERIREACVELSRETRDFAPTDRIPTLEESPESPLSFYRDFVAQNRPVLIKNAVRKWPAFEKWSKEYLSNKMGDSEITVAVTPNGYADAITGDYFVMPLEEKMKFSQFLDLLESGGKGSENPVHYVQKQNSNLTDEFSSIFEDIRELQWAKEAFGVDEADAINFWMGDERAVTSTHKDPYENIYCVIRGHKDITLNPPCDYPWVRYEDFPQAVYVRKEGCENSLVIEPLGEESGKVPWVTVDPLKPSKEYLENAQPLKVRVEEGDALYLPSMWYHHLVQSHGCVAVNFWYDMQFDSKYAYSNFLAKVANSMNIS